MQLRQQSTINNNRCERASFDLLCCQYLSARHFKAIHALEETILVLRESLLSYPISMNFAGIGHFRNKVLYANLLEDAHGSRSRMLQLSEILKEKLIQRGVYVVDKRPMTPHLTIIKLSKDETIFSKGLKQIHPSLYKVYSTVSFGACVINSIQLCERGERDSSGYYKVTREVRIIPTVPRALTVSLERSEPARKVRKIYPVEEDNVTIIN
ncbi:A-kinase anchor protein 7-like isoform X2 [Artemia franciscana]|uniref:A-kinase anchor protein 7-like phosphoesterase domain-containing protein n=1 Tax=Artemia franciscana TaxID=6661 RepID=A0AA88L1V7_ARTSF|nr:hypothetical protein QYM36_010427 [Artemia franciscana]